jgi:hypothetical protein
MKYQVLCEDNTGFSNIPNIFFRDSSIFHIFIGYWQWEESNYSFETIMSQLPDTPYYDGVRIKFEKLKTTNLFPLEEYKILVISRHPILYDAQAYIYLYPNAQSIWLAIEESTEWQIAWQVMES